MERHACDGTHRIYATPFSHRDTPDVYILAGGCHQSIAVGREQQSPDQRELIEWKTGRLNARRRFPENYRFTRSGRGQCLAVGAEGKGPRRGLVS